MPQPKKINNGAREDGDLPLVLAITGASGAIYGMRLLQYLMEVGQPVDLLVSNAAQRVMLEERAVAGVGKIIELAGVARAA